MGSVQVLYLLEPELNLLNLNLWSGSRFRKYPGPNPRFSSRFSKILWEPDWPGPRHHYTRSLQQMPQSHPAAICRAGHSVLEIPWWSSAGWTVNRNLTFEMQSVEHVQSCGKSEVADQHVIMLSEVWLRVKYHDVMCNYTTCDLQHVTLLPLSIQKVYLPIGWVSHVEKKVKRSKKGKVKRLTVGFEKNIPVYVRWVDATKCCFFFHWTWQKKICALTCKFLETELEMHVPLKIYSFWAFIQLLGANVWPLLSQLCT